jgi:DNA-binding response OmpR family regulator
MGASAQGMTQVDDRRHGTGTGRELVLVVEDEAMLALELEHHLSAAAYEVVVASDGPTALAICDGLRVPLTAAVVNLGLPGGMEGREVIRRLRAVRPGLPVVVVTGYHPLAQQADLRGTGGPTARLHKPVEPQDLLRRLRAAIASDNGIAG